MAVSAVLSTCMAVAVLMLNGCKWEFSILIWRRSANISTGLDASASKNP